MAFVAEESQNPHHHNIILASALLRLMKNVHIISLIWILNFSVYFKLRSLQDPTKQPLLNYLPTPVEPN